MNASLELVGLRHRFGSLQVLDGIDLRIVGPGVFGFLGVNGAGKSTTMRILNGFLRPSAGSARVLGRPAGPDDVEVRRRVGYLPQVPAFHGWMTGAEVLRLTADLYGMEPESGRRRSAELLERMALSEAAKRRCSGYSGGMKQRLGLAQALLSEPELLLLDEPVSALDPVGRLEVLDLIRELGERVTVFMSSHILADVERTCDHVTILHQGRIVADEPTETLCHRYARPSFVLSVEGGIAPLAHALGQAAALEAVESLEPEHGQPPGVSRLRLQAHDLEEVRRLVPRLVADHGLALHDFSEDAADLEAVFMRIVGHDQEGAP
jgi:ABC-2 type transport system ATP-binding protein